MSGIVLIMLFSALAMYCIRAYILPLFLSKKIKQGGSDMYFIAAALAAFALRIVLSVVFEGHGSDMSCFNSWSQSIFEGGFSGFYNSSGFHDYPPGYMYVLYIIGLIRHVLPLGETAVRVLLKLPAVMCDIVIGALVFDIAKKRFSQTAAVIFASLWLFNPVSILNSAVWGQVDSVYTLFGALTLYYITEKKMPQSYCTFALCLFIKPQAFILAPVLIGGFIENVILEEFSTEKLLKNIGIGLAAIGGIVILALPFGLANVAGQYLATIDSYPYFSVNAFNFWSALGKNWSPLITFGSYLGYLFLAAVSAYVIYILIKSKNASKYYFTGALITFVTYMFSVRMHERYAYPAVLFMLLAVVMCVDYKKFALFALLTLSQFFNTAWVLFIYGTDPSKYYNSVTLSVASVLNLALTGAIIYIAHRQFAKNDLSNLSAQTGKSEADNTADKTWSSHFPKLRRFDIVAMAVITAVYAGIAFYDLGDMHAAESEYILTSKGVTLDLGQDYRIKEIQYFLGSYELNSSRSIIVKTENSAGEQVNSTKITNGSVFHWEKTGSPETARYIKLIAPGDYLSIKEIGIRDFDGNLLMPVSVSDSKANALFDEQSEVPERSNFRNGTYFDEIYHARTAYEFIHHLPVYEWTHPPLGKVFISLGVKIFGMCPFGWRFMGTLFGIMMVPLIYLFALKFLKKSWFAVIVCLLFTFDFMHFAQTRIATIDVYVTFFIILMYYFMYRYCSLDIKTTSLRKELMWLGLCGIATGCAAACKWTGFYAASGIFVLWLVTFILRCVEYGNTEYTCRTKSLPNSSGSVRNFAERCTAKYIATTIICCIIFFVIVLLTIYVLSYIPYLMAPDAEGLKTILQNQEAMQVYHMKTVVKSSHPYSSHWYEWILMTRPIWYYSGTIADGVKEGISSFGNPLVWWAGVPAFFYMIYRMIKYRDKNALFLVISYLAQLVWWIPVQRITFIYHYFPCVPFIVMMIGYTLLCLYNNAKNKRAAMCGVFCYAALVIALFIMFYPVLSGQPCSVWYKDEFLKWFNSWVLL